MIISLNKFEKKEKPEDKFDVQPTTSDQFIEPTEGSVFISGTVRAVTSNIDVNIQPENIKQGVSILSVEGTLKEEKPEEIFNIQPTTTDQAITPTEGSVFISGTVRAVTSDIDVNIQPKNIKQGVSILGVEGTLTEGAGGDTPDYRYMKGTIDKAGLKAIGWTDEDILTYEHNKSPHYSWQNDQYIVSEENKSLYLLDDPNPDSYKNNPNITFVPKKNMESYFVKNSPFREMKYIKGIPFYNTSSITNASQMFSYCSNLTTIPPLDFSGVTNAQYMFSYCTHLTSIPQLDFSNTQIVMGMFQDCSSLTSIPQLNFSSVTVAQRLFEGCSSLTSIPQLNFSNVTDASGLFEGCSSLTSIPQLNFSNVTDASHLFQGCSSLTSIPQLNFSNVTDASSLFQGCSSLTSIPQLDFSSVTKANYMFSYCTRLTSIPQLDFSNVTDMTGILNNCDSLTTVEGIDFSGLTSDLKQLFGWTSNMSKITRFIVNGKINVSISDNYSIKALTAIDYDSVKSILAAADRTDNTNAKTLAFNRTMTDQNGELAALVTSCTSKGWTITGLTIN